MAIFEDVNGAAHVVSTQHSVREVKSVGESSSKHNRDGSVETSSHTVKTGPDGKSVTVDTLDTSKDVNGTIYHTTKVLSDDGQGHRFESLSNSFEQNRNGAHMVQSETVTKQLGAHEAPVDLTKALEERGTLGVTHDMRLTRETHDQSGATLSDTVARHFDTVGNESRSSWSGVSESAGMLISGGIRSSGSEGGSHGLGVTSGHTREVGVANNAEGAAAAARYLQSHSEGASSGHTEGVGVANNAQGAAAAARYLQSHSEGVYSGHTEGVGVANNAEGAAAAARYLQSHSEGVSSGHAQGVGVANNAQGAAAAARYLQSHSEGVSSGHASTGLSEHVSQSIENRLVSDGYSVAEARETVKGVSESLGHAVSTHTAGTSSSVEFHKEGPVAVSMTSGEAVSSNKTVALSMDELKAVHESGHVQSLQSGRSLGASANTMSGASMEMSR
jgi:hypothetical protein